MNKSSSRWKNTWPPDALSTCPHASLFPEVVDQTLGVACTDCNKLVGVCWMDEHMSERLWNRACKNDAKAVPCEQDREDHCFLCGEQL